MRSNTFSDRKQTNDVLDTISMFCILFITISSVFPPIRTIGNNMLFCTIAIVIWSFIAFIEKPNFFLKLPIYRCILIFFSLYTIIIPYILGNSVIGNRYADLTPMIMFYIVYDFNKETEKIKLTKNIIKVTLFFAFITLIRTGIQLLKNPYIVRSIKSSGTYSKSLALIGIGGYEFIYFLVFIIILAFYIIFDKRSKIYIRLISALISVISILIVILSNYFTALSVTLLCIGIMILLKCILNRNKLCSVFIIILIISISLFFKPIVISTCDLFVDIFPTGKNALRIMQIKESINNDSKGNIFSERLPTLTESFKATLRYPVMGLIGTEMEYSGDSLAGFGQHSHFLDTFALYGLVIGALGVYIFLVPFFRNNYKEDKVIKIPMLIATFIILMMNNATSSIGFVVLFIYPYFIDRFFVRTK